MLKEKSRNGIVFLVSDMLVSVHAFSTRIGGISQNEHTRGLNLGFGRGDTDDIVRKNAEMLAHSVGFDIEKLISLPQIHSDIVTVVDGSLSGMGVTRKSDLACDGYVSVTQGLPIGVKTADCVPILLEARDDLGEPFAVAAVHAGWRGTASRIAENAVNELLALGTNVENIYAAIGPCINKCCYEVGADFANEIETRLGPRFCSEYIHHTSDGKLFADLVGMNLKILTECGISEKHIDAQSICTCCHPELFYSHRRQGDQRGTMMSVIVKR